jgi:hypothetical protein
MRKILLLLFLSTAVFINAEDYIESFNIVSQDYVGTISDNDGDRYIYGGTIIIPAFDESCPEEMKGPFEYACKILEEIMPPCLPIKVQVSCGRMSASYSSAISKVKSICKENFGNTEYRNVPMTTIKGVILGEVGYDATVSYLDSVPDLAFLTANPDIEITYNEEKIDEISFSLDTTLEDKYDFVTIALRDLLRGLGISSSFKYNPVTLGLDYPAQELTPFECTISEALEDCEDSVARLAKATQGELTIGNWLKLYAPSPWVNGVSLNYLVPQNNCISNVLSYDFGKGCIRRVLSSGEAQSLFRAYLGWQYNIATGMDSSTSNGSGSTSIKVPYNDSITISRSQLTTSASHAISNARKVSLPTFYSFDAEISDYISSFHPFLTEDGIISRDGVSISILKKDGTWDLVAFQPYYWGGDISLNMNEWDFHYTNAEYARTIDGYLRARVTTSENNFYGRYDYNSTYFVADYLPQQIGLSYSLSADTAVASLVNSSSTTATTSKKIRLYFTNLEGIDKVVLERLRNGARLPTKTQITDFKSGYYDTTLDRKTTFTVVGYNDNGYTRSLPITVELPSAIVTEVSVSMSQDKLYVDAGEDCNTELNYTITSLLTNAQLKGTTDSYIDVADLPSGIYVLTLYNSENETLYTYKFKK